MTESKYLPVQRDWESPRRSGAKRTAVDRQGGGVNMLGRWLSEKQTQQPYDMIGGVRSERNVHHADGSKSVSEAGAEAGSQP